MKSKAFSWDIRKYKDGDEDAIFELLNLAFGKWHSMEYWEWLYKRNPAGQAQVWLAEHNNKLISHHALIPVKMKVGNACLTASYGGDAATHPDYQGRGIYLSLANQGINNPAEGVPLRLLIPDRNSRLFKETEYKGYICLLGPMTKVLNWSCLLRRSKHVKGQAIQDFRDTSEKKIGKFLPSGMEIRKIQQFDDKINDFWKEISNEYEIIVQRDKTYLDWRYVNHPEVRYSIYLATEGKRIVGYCVLREMAEENLRIGRIVDILGFTSPHNVVGQLIRMAVANFRENKLDCVQCFISEKHPYKAMLWKAGFVPYPPSPTAFGCAIYVPGKYSELEDIYTQALLFSQNPFLKNKRNWFLMSCDFDWI
jgi:hypothetical protein